MPLQSQLTRMAQNVGALTADTNAIFDALRAKGVDVPANAQLGDVAEMIESIEVPLLTVNIGGRDYPYVQIGNQLWLAENVDWKFDGCTIGTNSLSTTEMLGNYYNNDENTYGVNGNKYGLLYNYPSAIYINNNIPEGWRVPTIYDVNTLKAFLGDNPGTQLKSKHNWFNDGNGTDNYGFCGVPTGIRQDSFMYINEVTVFWTSTEISQYDVQERGISYDMSGIGGSWGTNKGFRFSVRLVKDAPGYVTIGNRQYKTVTIGNQEWLAENLDYKFSYNGSTIPIGSSGAPSTPAAWYYNNDEASYGIDGTYKCGLLYNWYAAKYLDDNKATLLPDGWHVSTDTEWGNLITELGANPAIKLKALNNSVLSNWPAQWNGTDDYGFKALPSGLYDSVFEYIDVCARYWTTNEYSYYNGSCKDISTSPNVGSVYPDKTYAMSIRLVKDVT